MKAPKSAKRAAGRGLAETASAGSGQGRLLSWEGRVDQVSLAADPFPRADVFIADHAKVLSRSQLKARDAVIRVNGKEVKPSRILKSGDRIELTWLEEPPSTLVPEDIPLVVLHEDEHCVVVDKAQGMVTHPGHGNRRGTLANALLGRVRPADGAAPVPGTTPALRAGIVHRLDKDTSGLLIAAKDAETQAFLADQFKQRTARKEYLAIVRGLPSPLSGRIADRLGRDRRDRKRFASQAEGGKPAVTDYRVLAVWSAAPAYARGADARTESYAFVLLRPRTGRTHQLRVHMAERGTPIVGDPIYGKRDPRFPETTLMLHAYRLRIVLRGQDRPSVFRAPLPDRMKAFLAALARSFGKGLPVIAGRPDPDRAGAG